MKAKITWTILALLTSPSLASSIPFIFTNISTQASTVVNALQAFPNTGAPPSWATGIHTKTVNLESSIDIGTSALNSAPKPLSEADGSAIVADAVGWIKPPLLQALQLFISREKPFQPFPGIPALIKQDLVNLDQSVLKFEAALISAAPADEVAQATSLKTTLDAAFASTLSAYKLD
ncbi:hypothetical protein GALMADRAFT_134762 [Galerina marginata CBS 339.88]|uniref:Uncharacterized protein n=1 Tax=Galerina marginata (strain CBS 339.88) TaxID=685588 RepID=A0A067TW88_GALM3|nr:hypothetical protein GALMADRAFT_134762 [Galerina marginata CBS 339.88]